MQSTSNMSSVPFPPPREATFTFIDLFAGIGGFRLALQALGGRCVFSSEWDKNAQKTYAANFGELPYGDITLDETKAMIPAHFDILTAGFPCQPFSISGKMRGFEDTRGTLIYDVLDIASVHQPKVVFLENVKHLKDHDSGKTLRTIIQGLEDIGYTPSWSILNASAYGVPQNRERIIIVATKSLRGFDFSALKPLGLPPALKPFLDRKGSFEFLTEPYTLINNPVRQKSGLIFAGYRNKKIRTAGVRPGTEYLSRVHKQPNRIYSSDGTHPALPSQESSGRFWILDDGRVRKLTITECYRIMGFPEDYKRVVSLGEQYKQIGNSVCVPLIKEVVKSIIAQKLL